MRTVSHPEGLDRISMARWGEDGVRRFRIPALTRSGQGTLIAAFDARPSMEDLPEHIRVVCRRSPDGGRTWGPRHVLLSDDTWSFGDPSLITDVERNRVVCIATSTHGTGFAKSADGNSPCDPGITQIIAAISDDDGVTWEQRVITAEVKDPRWRGMFATSGTGLQLSHADFSGRLVQPCVVSIEGSTYTVMTLSDDGGDTWWHGEPVGPGADETAVTELRDGRLLLSIRHTGGRRYSALSGDGGLTFSDMLPVEAHIDPGNNGSLLRLAKKAENPHAANRVLMLSHTADADIRQNLCLTFSFDDGESWPARVLIVPGSSGYSTLTRINDDVLGLLYEHDGYSELSFRRISLAELPVSPVLVQLERPVTLHAGEPASIPLIVRNTGGTTVRCVYVYASGADGMCSNVAHIPEIAGGAETTVVLTVHIPSNLAGQRSLELESSSTMDEHPFSKVKEGLLSFSKVDVSITAAGSPLPSLTVEPIIDAVYPDQQSPGLLGDLAVPWVRVRNTGNIRLNGVTLRDSSGSTLSSIEVLDPGMSFTFRDRSVLGHRLTQEDLTRGYWSAELSATAISPVQKIQASATTPPLSLL